MTLTRFQLLLAIGASFVLSVLGDDCTVTIPNGVVIGTNTGTVDPSKQICSYLGIPFAAPPVGRLRLKPPQPAAAWGSMNATKPPNWCPQAGTPPNGITIGEDCLYLNIYHPEREDLSNANLPVMIWFHGGGYTNGNTLHYYQPNRLLARGDIVLVVAHYRLGLLGFFSTGDHAAPGNYGLKDQAATIKWVNQNIRNFGGNPGQVTLFGESAGGGSVILQMLSPLNKGLIHGVIAQSGTALTVTSKTKAAESSKVMAEKLGCPTDSSSAIVACIGNKSWEEIILKQADTAPVVEPILLGAFITKQPNEIMKTGDIDNIPVMLGSNRHEGSALLGLAYISLIGPLQLHKNPEFMRNQIVPQLLKSIGIDADDPNRAVASTFEMAYLSGVNRSSWEESMPGLVDMLTAAGQKSPMQATADLLSKRGLNVYLYTFDHNSLNTVWSIYFGELQIPIEHGVTHGDELIYLFDFPSTFSPVDQAFSEKFCDMWLNFGISGNPTPLPDDRYEQWPTYDTNNEFYMKLNITPTANSGYRNSWRPNGFEWN